MRAILIDASSGEIVGKDLVTGYAQPAQMMRGVVLSNPPSTSRRKPKVTRSTHDPERPGGLLNGRKPSS